MTATGQAAREGIDRQSPQGREGPTQSRRRRRWEKQGSHVYKGVCYTCKQRNGGWTRDKRSFHVEVRTDDGRS
jgi:hypothetical protein